MFLFHCVLLLGIKPKPNMPGPKNNIVSPGIKPKPNFPGSQSNIGSPVVTDNSFTVISEVIVQQDAGSLNFETIPIVNEEFSSQIGGYSKL